MHEAELLREAPANTQSNLNVERIGAMEMPSPPNLEQRQIAKLAETETASLNAAISRLEREIDLLREYRARLVADVVTGRLDMRGAASKLHFLPVEEVLASEETLDEPGDLDDTEAEELLNDV